MQRRITLPEREAIELNRREAAELDAAHEAILARGAELESAEREVAGEVASAAVKAKEAQDHLYSGSVTASKELTGLQEELRLLGERQSKLEERELELLEAIEEMDRSAGENRASRDTSRTEADALAAALAKSEGEIDAELGSLSERRATLAGQVPPAMLAEYDRLRPNPRLAGRAAALLDEGKCAGCRLKIPTLQYKQMRGQPAETVLRCPHCKRVLVRPPTGS